MTLRDEKRMEQGGQSAFPVVIAGYLIVNVPVLLIGFGTWKVAQLLDYPVRLGALAVGIALAWIWWSYGGKRWMRWAAGRKFAEEDLVRIGKRHHFIWSR